MKDVDLDGRGSLVKVVVGLTTLHLVNLALHHFMRVQIAFQIDLTWWAHRVK